MMERRLSAQQTNLESAPRGGKVVAERKADVKARDRDWSAKEETIHWLVSSKEVQSKNESLFSQTEHQIWLKSVGIVLHIVHNMKLHRKGRNAMLIGIQQ